MKTYNYFADMGTMKIRLKDGSFFYNNGVGDGEYVVNILEPKDGDPEQIIPNKSNFVGHFTIFTKGYLSGYDCSNSGYLHIFTKGRYFVHLEKDGTFWINRIDKDLKC